MSKMNVKKGDTVEVISGEQKGTRGEVIRAMPADEKVLVRGVHMVKRHQKSNQMGQDGGIIEKESPIHVSNVALVCPTCDKHTRVGHGEIDGKKVRICKKCGATI